MFCACVLFYALYIYNIFFLLCMHMP
jgi:hypothetical protein